MVRILSISFVLRLILCAPAHASTPVLPDLHAPGGGPIRVEVKKGARTIVTTDYWRLEFDLRRGGVLDSIVFLHGSGRNVLVRPFRTHVGDWSDQDAGMAEVASSQDRDVVRLEFRGTMGAPGDRKGPVSFTTTWTLSPFAVRAEHAVRLAEDVSVRSAGIGSMSVRAELNEFSWRPGVATDSRRMHLARSGRAAGEGAQAITDYNTPLWLLVFHRAVEGFDLTPGSDYETWQGRLGADAGGRLYEVKAASDGSSVEILREPLHSKEPVTARKGEYKFAYYVGLPRIVERSNRKWRHLSLGNRPFPSDDEIRRWAENGVNVVRYHNDFSPDGNFWHDGAWPPYDEKGMIELRRVIAACKRNKIAIVPYFSVYEFHPEAQGFDRYAGEWMRMGDPGGAMIHNLVRANNEGEYGAQMCPNSGWLERRKQDIERAYRDLGFDGIYYDWVKTLSCFNPKHGSAHHLSTDQVVDLMAWTRRLVRPNGIVVLHIYGHTASLALENFADLVVNMEEASATERWMKITDVPIITRLAESIPRSPCPSYRPDHTVDRNRNNISQLVVLGMFPAWRATGPSVAPPGGPGYELTLKLFRDFKPYRLEAYRFHDAFSGAVKTASDDVYGAAYGSAEPPLVVISNTSQEKRSGVSWRVDASKLGFGTPARVTLKDTRSGETRTLPVGALSDGSLAIDLDGWEYGIFEIRAAK